MKKLELYKCEICGNIVEVVLNGEGTLVCCGEDMKLMLPNTTDGMREKHVPVLEEKDGLKIVKVGSEPHPMVDSHYIEFIEAISNDEKYVKRKYLSPNDKPELILTGVKENNFKMREHCNIHGLFENKGE